MFLSCWKGFVALLWKTLQILLHNRRLVLLYLLPHHMWSLMIVKLFHLLDTLVAMWSFNPQDSVAEYLFFYQPSSP
ncbi:hypothetical protein L873DRAFT_1818017 [Choiromyces venosus 120613-1]|uniref:Uncharacterized protein n=1 Tax=Choiromyces venosus 120613-1 TaxID=1336337 RepID=A0A3N4J1T1_9PEZI|nr:hypothetical protein L873DRAFT_1818017 [Choiromyces venosus 120613-1]